MQFALLSIAISAAPQVQSPTPQDADPAPSEGAENAGREPVGRLVWSNRADPSTGHNRVKALFAAGHDFNPSFASGIGPSQRGAAVTARFVAHLRAHLQAETDQHWPVENFVWRGVFADFGEAPVIGVMVEVSPRIYQHLSSPRRLSACHFTRMPAARRLTPYFSQSRDDRLDEEAGDDFLTDLAAYLRHGARGPLEEDAVDDDPFAGNLYRVTQPYGDVIPEEPLSEASSQTDLDLSEVFHGDWRRLRSRGVSSWFYGGPQCGKPEDLRVAFKPLRLKEVASWKFVDCPEWGVMI